MFNTLIRLSKEIYHRLPLSFNQRLKIKRYIIRKFPKLMGRMMLGNLGTGSFAYPGDISNLIDATGIEPVKKANGKIAIHLHIFYVDLIGEFVNYLRNMPFDYDLYVSVVSQDAYEQSIESFRNLPFSKELVVKIVPNQGRDIAPFFCAFGEQLKQYEIVGHFHSKKSLYNQGATEGWREYLLDSLLGSQEQIKKIFSLLQEKKPYGLVYPQTYFLLPYQAHTWLANKGLAEMWCSRLGFVDIPRGYFDYPAGSMFWARTEALMPLFNAKITLEDFPEESGQSDGTLAHTLERLVAVSSRNLGMRLGILADPLVMSWSSWRLEQYTNRSYSDLKRAINHPTIKVIGFDLFDTLFCRPLLDPESTKEIVASRVDEQTGNLYREFRAVAENQARILKGSDVGLGEVYAQFARMTGITNEKIQNLRNLEEEIEITGLSLRPEILRLYQDALSTGKKVVLVSDTTLPKESLTSELTNFGFYGWDDFFVSNDIGLRKDNSSIYPLIYARYDLSPNEFLMIGDNERSDYQIPVDMGSGGIHLMRPVEMARGLPRLSPLIHQTEKGKNLDEEISLGLVVRKNFSPIYLKNFDPASLFSVTPYNIGYSIVGPLLVSFSNWLVETAQKDGIKRLYFLSREGKIMRLVYDCWTKEISDAPIAEYLVLSRRSTGVPAVKTFADIERIAKTNFYPNRIEKFLAARFGLYFSDEEWIAIARNTGMQPENIIEIQNGNLGQVSQVLKYLEPEIMANADIERIALLKYLEIKGLKQGDPQAVVDVGYSGTVQGHLNKLLPEKVNGYYLMTDERSKNIASQYQVALRGCFDENIVPRIFMPPMFKDSFLIEKLLSSNDPQIEFYEMDEQGSLVEHFRALSNIEIKANKLRDEIQTGCLQYAEDASQIRKRLLPGFNPSINVAKAITEAFLSDLSSQESEFLSQIILDDYYCGRDLVA